MGRRKHKIHDPAEAARKAYETRRNPALWGPNEEAIKAQGDIQDSPETRNKTRRVERFDCFATLGLSNAAFSGVRRYQALLAARYRCEGADRLSEFVDGSGSAELVTARSLDAASQIDALKRSMDTAWHMALIEALSMPTHVQGVQANWHGIVKHRTGLIDRDAQAKAVKQASEGLARAWSEIDNGMKKAA